MTEGEVCQDWILSKGGRFVPASGELVRSSKTFSVGPRYIPLMKLGCGSSGIVCSARDTEDDGKLVAIKKVQNYAESELEFTRMCREVSFMRQLDHPNVVKLRHVMTGREESQDLYLVIELMHSDLQTVIQTAKCLKEKHIALIMYQILRGLDHMHSHGIVHRDLKPGNILINKDCSVKIADLGISRRLEGGSACRISPEDDALLTGYVASRYYRAPEVIVSNTYDYEVDMWAVGCIFAELFRRDVLFAGKTCLDQLKKIFRVIGTPVTREDWKCITDKNVRAMALSWKRARPVPLRSVIPEASELALDLLSQLLVFNPAKRLNAADALKHPFFIQHM